jgi:hypothetical protein
MLPTFSGILSIESVKEITTTEQQASLTDSWTSHILLEQK